MNNRQMLSLKAKAYLYFAVAVAAPKIMRPCLLWTFNHCMSQAAESLLYQFHSASAAMTVPTARPATARKTGAEMKRMLGNYTAI